MLRLSGVAGRSGAWIVWLASSLVFGCSGGGGDGGGSGTSAPASEPEPVGLYESCNPATCEEGSCRLLAATSREICTDTCSNDAECPANPEGGVTCEEGVCRPYVCNDRTPHLTTLGSGLICIRGEVMACADLTEVPCQCGCEPEGACDDETGVCVPKLPLGESCTDDAFCASGYCAIGQFGGGGFCALAAGEACSSGQPGQCDAYCNAPANGGDGYCLVECEVYCGGSGGGCEHRCEDSSLLCMTDDVCRVRCTGDDECLDWELCVFESITDAVGACYPNPDAPGTGGSGGTGGAGATGGMGGTGGGGAGTAPLGAACESNGDCVSGVCADPTFVNGGLLCVPALGDPCLDIEARDLCDYTVGDVDAICFTDNNWSICTLSCDPNECAEGFECARYYQSDEDPPLCADELGAPWCARKCSDDLDCGDSLWRCDNGLCEPTTRIHTESIYVASSCQ